MTNGLTKTSAFNGVVSALVKIAEGEVELRLSVADYVNAGGTVHELHAELKSLDDIRCHKSVGYLRKIQSRCRQVGLLPEATQGRRGGLTSQLPVENPQELSQLLPTQRDVKAYAKAPIEVREQVVAISNGEFPTLENQAQPGSHSSEMIEHIRSLIDPETWEIDTSGHTDEQKDAMLLRLNTTLEATQAQMMFDHQLFDATLAEFGSCDSAGNWNPHKPLKIIKNLLPQLTSSEREQLIDSLLSPIN